MPSVGEVDSRKCIVVSRREIEWPERVWLLRLPGLDFLLYMHHAELAPAESVVDGFSQKPYSFVDPVLLFEVPTITPALL